MSDYGWCVRITYPPPRPGVARVAHMLPDYGDPVALCGRRVEGTVDAASDHSSRGCKQCARQAALRFCQADAYFRGRF